MQDEPGPGPGPLVTVFRVITPTATETQLLSQDGAQSPGRLYNKY